MTKEKEFFLTEKGIQEMEAKLENLKTEKRREIAEKIKVATSFGDLSENAEYDEAKNEQAQVEERIMKMENILRNAIVIEEDQINTDSVTVGTKVRILDKDYNEELTYYIVGTAEADPKKGRISNESPVGAALLDKTVGDIVEVYVGDILSQYEILEISI